jgi:hypothetical protein
MVQQGEESPGEVTGKCRARRASGTDARGASLFRHFTLVYCLSPGR